MSVSSMSRAIRKSVVSGIKPATLGSLGQSLNYSTISPLAKIQITSYRADEYVYHGYDKEDPKQGWFNYCVLFYTIVILFDVVKLTLNDPSREQWAKCWSWQDLAKNSWGFVNFKIWNSVSCQDLAMFFFGKIRSKIMAKRFFSKIWPRFLQDLSRSSFCCWKKNLGPNSR